MAKEKEIAVCRRHWSGFVVPGFFCVLFVLGAIGMLFIDAAIGNRLAAMLVMLAIAAVIAGYIFISYKFTYSIVLTETKLVGHKGLIRSKTLTAPLSKVQDIGLSNGLMGKIFGYHTVTISSAGTANTEFVFIHMAGAQKFVDAVNDSIAAKQ